MFRDVGMKVAIIEADEHWQSGNFLSKRILDLTFHKDIGGTICFNFDPEYPTYSRNDGHINKLIGLSDGWHHHKNSARLGWRWREYEEMIEIVSYCYVGGVRTIKHIMFCSPYKTYPFRIIITKKCYKISFGHITVLTKRKSNWGFVRAVLPFYFGGKPTAFRRNVFNYFYFYNHEK
tara:strand:+ start:1034 stop:1564 length:531 start_codon:yes stop_codon:yes gene_type:complete